MMRRLAPAVTDAKRSHPASSWQPDHDHFRRRVEERLRDDGCARPEFVAAVLEVRARLGLDVAGFAELLRVDRSVVDEAEAGCPARAVVLALARLAPDIDWPALIRGPARPALRRASDRATLEQR
ncbi:MAG TPA: hypothetical protein VM121_00785 [Acidimicrobiales bacterium]|nr:hypothetical protein [Acidimicrobiales bacterium]